MVQVTIELDEDTAARLRAAAQQAGMALGDWLAALVRDRAGGGPDRREPLKPHPSWPPEIIAMAGSWPDDFPMAEEIRAWEGEDAPREPM